MAVTLDRLIEAGECRLQGRSAGAPAHLPSRTALGRGDDAKMGEGHAFRTLWTKSNERRERNHGIRGGREGRGMFAAQLSLSAVGADEGRGGTRGG